MTPWIRSCLAALLLGVSLPTLAATDPNSLLQLVDYVGVDYAGAVSDGQVSNPSEYAEMQEFAGRIGKSVADLPDRPAKPELAGLAETLSGQVKSKADPAAVAQTAKRLREALMGSYPVSLTPRKAPDLAKGQALFQANCASCHGATGHGDGPAAASLDPGPTNFHDAERARQRSLFGLYNTITLGVEGTAMPSFSQLSDHQRWSLAFYVGGLFADKHTLAAGAAAWEQGGGLSLKRAVTSAPGDLAGDGPAEAAWVRHHPEALFQAGTDPIQVTIDGVADSAEAYAAGDKERAQSLAVAAYLDGFELAEAGLKNVAPGLVSDVESAMIQYRSAIRAGAPVSEIQDQASAIGTLLQRAQNLLEEKTLSPWLAFLSSLVILLREGLEAILILAAVTAFLVRTGRREALLYLHYGWIGALALGVATWAAATWVIDISGAMREVTEGVTALIAAGILFYVGFWMHNKLNAQRWNKFLTQKVQKALDGRTLWGVAFIAFIAVYREVFETVLFYEALWAQVDAGSRMSVLGGGVAAAAGLVTLTWAIFKFGLRLPLRQFFSISAAAMFILAVVFAGKGVAALQEAGKLPISPITFPRIDLLGIYPNIQSLSVQLLLVLIAGTLVWWNRRGKAPVAA